MQALEFSTAPDLEGASTARFDVRTFTATEGISTLFKVQIEAMHPSASLDFDAIVGKEARFSIAAAIGNEPLRSWSGLVNQLELVRAVPEEGGLCTYRATVVPRLWLLTQRRNYRIFQFLSEVEIAEKILGEWKIDHRLELDRKAYKARKYKVQYAETDYEFVYRILADAGVSFFFEPHPGGTRLVLADAPQKAPRLAGVLPFEDQPMSGGVARSHFTSLRRAQRVRPTRVTLRDRDYRLDAKYELQASAAAEGEAALELFYYPENFGFTTEKGDGGTPQADDRGRTRADETEAKRLAQVDLESKRNDAATIRFESNDLRLGAGAVVRLDGHPSATINEPTGFLVVEARVAGRFDGDPALSIDAVSATHSYRPTLADAPRIIGVETATTVGPVNEEIHTDEFGRIRVHFHWDRETAWDETSSCWIPVSHAWAGSGFGGSNLPRVGQEVLVEFLGGDPDRPIVTGRVYTNLQKTPYKLPANKTQSGWKSNSTGGGGGYNEIMFEDLGGSELMRFQAERDRQSLVKRNCSTDVRSNRSTTVGGNESKKIAKSQSNAIRSHRKMRVGGNQKHKVDGSIDQQSKISTSVTSTGPICTSGATAYHEGKGTVTITVGDSTIFMTTSFIIIQSGQVFINPGKDKLAQAMTTGQAPSTAAEKPEGKTTSGKQTPQSRPEPSMSPDQRRDVDALVQRMMRENTMNPMQRDTPDRRKLNADIDAYRSKWCTLYPEPMPAPGPSMSPTVTR